jgi:hypothetical protein
MNEFKVFTINRVGHDEVLVDGRCYSGIIEVGGFLRVVNQLQGGPVGDYTSPVERIPRAEVELVVQSIYTYGKYINRIEEGLTARIALRGKGIEAIFVECTLSDVVLPQKLYK